MKQSRTVSHPTVVESPRHLPLVDLLVDARSELFERAALAAAEASSMRGWSGCAETQAKPLRPSR